MVVIVNRMLLARSCLRLPKPLNLCTKTLATNAFSTLKLERANNVLSSQDNIRFTGTGIGKEFRLNFFSEKCPISPWHDIKLYCDDENESVNFICEIPKNESAKMEIATTESFNPIKQDIKNGELREKLPLEYNYGALPQTWEDPDLVDNETKCKGDNDPIDAVEIGFQKLPVGTIRRVKVLGALALIDDGETDWKVICVDIRDTVIAPSVHTITDLEQKFPSVIPAIREHFRSYKSPVINSYGYNEECLNSSKALEVVAEAHDSWKKLFKTII